jgi:hypothetical protein
MAVFSVVAMFSLIKIYRRFGRVCCLHHEENYGHRPDDGGGKHF